MRKMWSVRGAVYGAVLVSLVSGLWAGSAGQDKPGAGPQVIDMESFRVSPPPGGKWHVQVNKDQGRIDFTKSKGGGVLGMLAPTPQQRDMIIIVEATTFRPKNWAMTEAEALDVLIDEYVRQMPIGSGGSFKLVDKGDVRVGEKTLRTASFRGTVPAADDPDVFVSQDTYVYFYFPPDYRRTHRFFRFESYFFRADTGMKLYRNPGEEPVFAVIGSLEIPDPLAAVPGPDGELLRAAIKGDAEAARLALDHGAAADAAVPAMTALGAAAWAGKRDVVDLLLARGANIDKADTADRRTPLHQALIGGEAEIAAALLRAGAQADPRTLAGYSPLIYASVYGFSDIAADLIARGADVAARSNDGETALSFAAQGGSLETAKALIAKGADLNAQTNDGWTPLMCALDLKRNDMARLLLGGGADPGLKAKTGWTVLMTAITIGRDPAIVRALIEKKADVNAKLTDGGWMPLHFALSYEGLDEIAEALIDAGADVRATLSDGTTTLMLAVENASAETVKLLLSKGVDVNAKGAHKRTALKLASRKKRGDIVQILKAAGAK